MKRISFLFFIGLISLCGCAQQNNTAAVSENNNDSVIVKTLPVGLPIDEIMTTIGNEFKGKVVVVDFWATWCPPCMAAMKSIDPIKEKYLKEGKPVVFVYVTGETSPLEKWKATIPTIKGYHYRLSNKEFNGLLTQMGIRGIPTYYIIGANGKCSYENIATGGYPGDDVIVAQIEEALNKK